MEEKRERNVLRKAQKEAVLTWIAAGMRSDEINERAAQFDPPFTISRSNVERYRRTRKIEIQAIAQVGETEALTTGLALRENRVLALRKLAALLEKDIFGGFLWLEDSKGVGQGFAAEVIDFDKFNAEEVAQYRGVLDDLAAETGGRVRRAEVTGKDGKDLMPELSNDQIAQRVASLIALAQEKKDSAKG